MATERSEQFDRYIAEGDRAIRLHPDFDQLEYETAASDMIASILHAVFDADRPAPDLEHFDTFRSSPEAMLDTALRAYEGDQEDRDPLALPVPSPCVRRRKD